MPLSKVKPGERVKFVTVTGGRRLQARLAAMGMIPGVELEVICNNFQGPFIVAIRNSRVMIGRGMAQKIEVE